MINDAWYCASANILKIEVISFWQDSEICMQLFVRRYLTFHLSAKHIWNIKAICVWTESMKKSLWAWLMKSLCEESLLIYKQINVIIYEIVMQANRYDLLKKSLWSIKKSMWSLMKSLWDQFLIKSLRRQIDVRANRCTHLSNRYRIDFLTNCYANLANRSEIDFLTNRYGHLAKSL